MEVVDVINRSRGKLIGIGVLVDRSEKPLGIDIPVYSCIRSETITYRSDKCPLCEQGVPLVKPGSSEV